MRSSPQLGRSRSLVRLRKRALTHLIVTAALLVLGGCFGNEETPFPDGLEPLEENDLPGPGTPADPFPEDYQLEGTEGRRHHTVLGRGFIHAPLATVWEAFRDPAVGADRRTSPDWSSSPLEDEAYDHSFLVHHITTQIVTVEWDVTWRQAVVSGTADMPELIALRWQKTSGSTLINVIEGSLILRPVGDGSITELELAYRANATGAGLSEFMQYMRDIFDDAVAVVHGRELPEI